MNTQNSQYRIQSPGVITRIVAATLGLLVLVGGFMLSLAVMALGLLLLPVVALRGWLFRKQLLKAGNAQVHRSRHARQYAQQGQAKDSEVLEAEYRVVDVDR